MFCVGVEPVTEGGNTSNRWC